MSNPSDRDTKSGVSRRSFLHKASVGAAVAATVGVTGVPSFAGKQNGTPADRAAAIAARNQHIREAITPGTGVHEGYTRIEDVFGPHYAHVQPGAIRDAYAKPNGLAGLLKWNRVAIDATGLDHKPVAEGENRVFGQQLGPCRAARAMGIIHMAMFEAMNAITPKYQSITHLYTAPKKTNRNLAVAQAAYDTLTALFSSQKDRFDALLQMDLDAVPNSPKKDAAILLGHTAALVVLGLCYNDGSSLPEPKLGVNYTPSDLPGHWRQDPIAQQPIALGAQWNKVRPFMMTSASQFRIPPPPALNSAEYTAAYDEVKRVGGDGVDTPTERTEDQSVTGVFWAYDGTPSLCAPPRLYNQIAVQLLQTRNPSDIDMARGLALVNLGLAEAAIASWDSKFFYDFWRPVTGIREADAGTGPTGAGDGNPDTIGDPTYHPFGAPASNLQGPNFTPPFPSYPSGHATFGGTLFQIFRHLFGTDDIAFTFTSDEFDGETPGNDGTVRPLTSRSFQNFTQAEIENGQSRIYLGIHWAFDASSGIDQGHKVADYVFANAFQPK